MEANGPGARAGDGPRRGSAGAARSAERGAGQGARRGAAFADDARGEGRPAHAGRRHPLRRRPRARGGLAQGRRRLRALGERHQALQRAPEARGRGVAAQDPCDLRARRDPRLPHDLPDPARHGGVLGPVRARARRRSRGQGGSRRRHPLDLRADAGHRARRALGPDRRGRGRGPLPGVGRRGGPGARLPGAVPRSPRPFAGLRQALRRLRRR